MASKWQRAQWWRGFQRASQKKHERRKNGCLTRELGSNTITPEQGKIR